jgi:hypothetical protein
MPGTKDVSSNIKELYRVRRNPSESSVPSIAGKRSRAQIIAIAESQARKAGGGFRSTRKKVDAGSGPVM